MGISLRHRPPDLGRAAVPGRCAACGFAAADVDRLGADGATLCPLCEAGAFALDADPEDFAVVWLPELTQADLAHLARTVLVVCTLVRKPGAAAGPATEKVADALANLDFGGGAEGAAAPPPSPPVPKTAFLEKLRKDAGSVWKDVLARQRAAARVLRVSGAEASPKDLAALAARLDGDGRAALERGLRLAPKRFEADAAEVWLGDTSSFNGVTLDTVWKHGGWLDDYR